MSNEMTEPEVLREIVKNLWYRVRLLEMFVVRHADNMDTRNMLHEVRDTLYDTGELQFETPTEGTFESVEQSLKAP